MKRGYTSLVPHSVFAISELRNAVAHDRVVFDTRFAVAKIRRRVAQLLGREIGFEPTLRISFDTITDYLALVVFLSVGLELPERQVHQATEAYSSLSDELRAKVPARAFDMIVDTDNRAKVRWLEAWVRIASTSRKPQGILRARCTPEGDT